MQNLDRVRVLKCLCGAKPVYTRTSKGKKYSCPNLVSCPFCLSTGWHKKVDIAIIEWNNMVNDIGRWKGGKYNG